MTPMVTQEEMEDLYGPLAVPSEQKVADRIRCLAEQCTALQRTSMRRGRHHERKWPPWTGQDRALGVQYRTARSSSARNASTPRHQRFSSGVITCNANLLL